MANLGDWLRPAKSVPHVSWAAGQSNWRSKPSTFAILVFGLWLFGTGEAALIAANIGVAPWTVFGQGISRTFSISIGWATFAISVAVLLLWFPLRSRPGLGTIMNILVIAYSIEAMIPFFPTPQTRYLAILQVLVGMVIVGLGSALYITCNLGPGPRDGLMTGLHRVTGVRIGRTRMFIEATVLTIGWLLGGTVGIGTIIFATSIGQSVALSLGLVERLDKGFRNLGRH